MRKIKGTDGGEHFSRLLDGGDAGPLPLLEELHSSGIVQGGRRMSAEEGGKTLAVGQSRRAGAVRQLRQGDKSNHVRATAMMKVLYNDVKLPK